VLKKRRGKIPSLLSFSTGKPYKDTTKKEAKCNRCNLVILKEKTCFKVPKRSNGFTNDKIHCLTCVQEILQQTQKEIDEVKEELQNTEESVL